MMVLDFCLRFVMFYLFFLEAGQYCALCLWFIPARTLAKNLGKNLPKNLVKSLPYISLIFTTSKLPDIHPNTIHIPPKHLPKLDGLFDLIWPFQGLLKHFKMVCFNLFFNAAFKVAVYALFEVFEMFSLGRVVLYSVFMVESLPKTLVKNPGKKNVEKPGHKSGQKFGQQSRGNLVTGGEGGKKQCKLLKIQEQYLAFFITFLHVRLFNCIMVLLAFFGTRFLTRFFAQMFDQAFVEPSKATPIASFLFFSRFLGGSTKLFKRF